MTDSSTADATSVDVSTVTDVVSATSSNADEGVKSYQDAIDAALGGTEEAPTSASGDEATTPKPTVDAGADGAKGDEPKDPTDDELKGYSHNAQSRIRELVDRRKAVESQLSEKDQVLETMRPQAERMGQIESFMQANSIEPEHLDNTLNIAALIQTGKFEQALQAVGPIYKQLLDLTGSILPPELQQEVDAGYLTQQHAAELHRAKTANANASERETAETERKQRERAETAHTDRVNMMAQTGDSWATEKKTSDPDWSTKQDLVNKEVELQLRRIATTAPRDLPTTKEGVRKLLDGCLKTVEDQLRVFRPAPQAITPLTGRPASAGARSKPTSYMDAIEQALGQTS